MAQEVDKWQKRQAEVLAEEEGISYEEAVGRVLGRSRPRKAAAVQETPPAGKTEA